MFKAIYLKVRMVGVQLPRSGLVHVPLSDLRHGGDSDRPTPYSGYCVFDQIRRWVVDASLPAQALEPHQLRLLNEEFRVSNLRHQYRFALDFEDAGTWIVRGHGQYPPSALDFVC